MSIFKAYDVRGIYTKELDEESAYKIGRAFADYMNVNNILIGRDMRLSSDPLFLALVKGITKQGTDVIDIGMVSTPMCYFGCAFLKVGASIMITASHNPKEYNGFKFTKKSSIPIGELSGIKEIEKIYIEGKFKKSSKKGKIIKNDIMDDYVSHVLSFVDLKKIKPLNVVIDAGSGMACKEVPPIYGQLPCKVTKLCFEIDGNFPNHDANPLKDENVADIKNEVIKQKTELGIAFDGDADRVFFISDKGEKIPSDFITCLIAKEFLKKEKGTILYDIRSSWIVKETVEKLGGKAVMSRVGHTLIKEQLRREKGIFGGELSGHFYFRDNFYTDSGIIASLKIIEHISQENKPFSEIIKPLKKYYQSGEINSTVKDKDGKIKLLAERYKDGKISFLDGIRVDYDDWWFNVRPSNTEPLLRLNLEAKSKKMMERKRNEVLRVIRG